jgi:FAD binding domain
MNGNQARNRSFDIRRPDDSLQRRTFARWAASMVVGGACALKSFRTHGQTVPTLDKLPRLDGEMLFDESSRDAVSDDRGLNVHRSPIAVLRPGSVNDVARMVGYANQRGLKIAMRGQGHSLYGQALVEGGIVIDSSTLNSLRWHGNDVLDAQPGATWGQVAKETLTKRLSPAVMPDAMMLTIGGTLSVGGIGETSWRSGAQVDHVHELDVVTGEGAIVTCSPERDSELFRMTLAGLGQCGLIVGARLRLIAAPNYVAARTFWYDDSDAMIADQTRLAQLYGLQTLNGGLTREQDGRWRYALTGGTFVATEGEGRQPPSWVAGLRVKSDAAPMITSYWDYLNRRAARQAGSVARAVPGPRRDHTRSVARSNGLRGFCEAHAVLRTASVPRACGAGVFRTAHAAPRIGGVGAGSPANTRIKSGTGGAGVRGRRKGLSAFCTGVVARSVAPALRCRDLGTLRRRQEALRSTARIDARRRHLLIAAERGSTKRGASSASARTWPLPMRPARSTSCALRVAASRRRGVAVESRLLAGVIGRIVSAPANS